MNRTETANPRSCVAQAQFSISLSLYSLSGQRANLIAKLDSAC